MANIAIICEGISESMVISHIVSRYCGDHNLNPIQPKIKNGKQDGFGGWEQVLEHCNEKKFSEIFGFNDFLIVQIDTDAAHHKTYGVPPNHPDGTPKSPTRLHAEVKVRLLKDIPRTMRAKYNGKMIFAICNNEIECWLLPLYYTGKQACKTNNCIFTLNQALKKHNEPCIADTDKNCSESKKAYRLMLKKLRRKSDVETCAKHSFGFSAFLKGLITIQGC